MSWSLSTAGTLCRAVQSAANMATWNNFTFDNICPLWQGMLISTDPTEAFPQWGNLSPLWKPNPYFCFLFSLFSPVINPQSSSSDPVRALVLQEPLVRGLTKAFWRKASKTCLSAREEGSWLWLMGRWWQGSLAAVGFCISCARQRSRARDVGPVVSPDCLPISKEGEESGILCLKICQSLRLHVTHSVLFPARLSH